MTDLPIDYLADHLDSFEIGAKFVPGMGFFGIIRFNEKEVFRSGEFKPEAQIAIDHATQFLENRYHDLMIENNIP